MPTYSPSTEKEVIAAIVNLVGWLYLWKKSCAFASASTPSLRSPSLPKVSPKVTHGIIR